MSLKLERHKQFKKDMIKIRFTDGQFEKFLHYCMLLLNKKILPAESKNHTLKGEWEGCKELHLGGDLLLIYIVKNNALILIRMGTHSQLFR